MAVGVTEVRAVWAASDVEPCVTAVGMEEVRRAALASRGVACTLVDGLAFVEAAARDAGAAACDAAAAEDNMALLTSDVVVCGGIAMCEGAGRGPRRLEASLGLRRLEASPGLESGCLVAPVNVGFPVRPEESEFGARATWASSERWRAG
jgi:hypothetical protein